METGPNIDGGRPDKIKKIKKLITIR